MKQEPKSVQIPYTLFKDILFMFEILEEMNLSEDFRMFVDYVHGEFQNKQKRIDLRDFYSSLVAANKAKDGDRAFTARIEYLKKRRDVEQ